jgi:hypothetical protein
MNTTLQQPRTWPYFAGGIAVLAAVGAWFTLRTEPAPKAAEAAPTLAAEPAREAPAQADAPLPPAEDSDARMRRLLSAISKHPLLARWLGEEDLLRRTALVLDNVAEGVVPRRPLAALLPEGRFATRDDGGRPVISDQSYRRFDSFGDAVTSIDAQALATAYRALEPLLAASWHALGYPGRSLDARVAEALQRLAEAPRATGHEELVPAGKLWIFVDPKVEALGPVEKQLLRMGPRNAHLVQLKAAELQRALGLHGKRVAGK